MTRLRQFMHIVQFMRDVEVDVPYKLHTILASPV